MTWSRSSGCFFWICIHYNGPNEVGRVVLGLEEWNYTDTKELAELKKGIVADEGDFLTTAGDIFTPFYRFLIRWVNRLRKLVFPNGGRWKEEDPMLYFEMKKILDEAQKNPELTAIP